MGESTSVLDVPVGVQPDPDEFVRAAMAWHFDPETGSPFWLERARTLGFDPRNDVKTFGDLAMFPNVTDELRDVPVEQLIPKGFGREPNVVAVIESGGTTGSPKRLPLLKEFADRLTAVSVVQQEVLGTSKGRNWLLCMPGGPHSAFEQHKRAAHAYGALAFGIDIDPRWVRKRLSEGHREETDAYTEHLVEQAGHVLKSQNVVGMRCTPPVLARIVRHDDLVEIIRDRIEFIGWGGASMDPDSRYVYRNELFPKANILGGYGTTMALGGGVVERFGLTDDDPCIFDPPLSPHVSVSVVDPDIMRQVDYGARGQLVVNHLSRSFLLPNNLERDTAMRVEPQANQVGDSVADISPVADFKGAQVIEGVY